MVMGILNVTPDSFSDGGRYFGTDAAVERGRAMAAEGADVVDVGGESTRPGAAPVHEAEELRRVVPVVEALAPTVRVSVDTTKAAVAREAVAAGATLLNDISGTMWPLAAELSVGWVGMHMRGNPATMDGLATYDDVVAEVHDHLLALADRAAAAGVPEIWVDPGIGFAKRTEHNLALLAGVRDLVAAAGRRGARVVVGTSRKRFLGELSSRRGPAAPVTDRLEASLATAVWCMGAGVGMVRVHDVADTVRAARLVGPVAA